jgi:conjugal transfer pilus assembly protein TrbC
MEYNRFLLASHLPLVLLSASTAALAQESFSQSAIKQGQAVDVRQRMPTQEEMLKVQQKVKEAMGRLPEAARTVAPSMPKVDALPKPVAPAPDLASIAEKYRQIQAPAIADSNRADLMIFASLSMPKEALVRTAEQAERAGATLVFRGLKGDSMTKMGEEIKAIVGSRSVSVVVHPPAFQQFGVSRVPTFVLARGDAGNQTLENGCSKPETFVKVSGDVSLDYALDYIERKSQAWAAVAKEYRSRIVRGIN